MLYYAEPKGELVDIGFGGRDDLGSNIDVEM